MRSWLGWLLWGIGIGDNCAWSCLVLEFWRMTTKLWWGKEFSSVALLSTLQSHCLMMQQRFMDKSGDRVHLMFLEFLRNLRDLPQYSWGSGCLAWLYRELCRASHKETSQIGGVLQLVQYWTWVRLPFLCPRIERPLRCDYGPWPKAPLAFK